MKRNGCWSAAVLSAAMVFAGCGGDPNAPATRDDTNSLEQRASSPPLVPRKILPRDTDSMMQDPRWSSEHYVWLDPTAAHRKKLFVHMPGTGNPPSSFQLVAQEAARLDYHVIVLSYPNHSDIATICREKNGTVFSALKDAALVNCEKTVRLWTLTGHPELIKDLPPGYQLPEYPASFVKDITPAESIENRLTQLLLYLAERFPEENWSEFLDDEAPTVRPAWKRIAISGSSFGGSEAALIASLHRVRRVTLFAAPRDFSMGMNGSWIALGETAPERYYGLVHQEDPRRQLTVDTWKTALGMKGPTVFVEKAPAGYDGSHTLLTELPARGNAVGDNITNAHPSVSRDQFTPVAADGVNPLLGAAWRYMLGADEDGRDGEARDEDVSDSDSSQRGGGDDSHSATRGA